MNLSEIMLFHLVWGVSNAIQINIIKFCENVLSTKYLDNINFGKKIEKVKEHDLY